LRGTFIINPEGKLLNMEMNFYNLGRNIDEMMRKFKANIYMSKKTNEVCPSKWKEEGDKTLVDPGAKRVGKVHAALTTETAAPAPPPARGGRGDAGPLAPRPQPPSPGSCPGRSLVICETATTGAGAAGAARYHEGTNEPMARPMITVSNSIS